MNWLIAVLSVSLFSQLAQNQMPPCKTGVLTKKGVAQRGESRLGRESEGAKGTQADLDFGFLD
jgi:hypothetical protein